MQYIRNTFMLWFRICFLLIGVLGAQNALAFQASSTFYFFPKAQSSLNQTTPAPPFEPKNIMRLPPSTWQLASPHQDHFGFNQTHVLLKIVGTPSQNQTILAIDNRYLKYIKVLVTQNSQLRNAPTKNQLTSISPGFSLGFKSAKTFKIPQDTQTIYIEAMSHSALIVPLQFLSPEQAQVQNMSATWSLGIFFGIAFFSLLICGFYYFTLQQKALGLICLFIISLILYVISKSSLHFITSVPLEYFSKPYIQLSLLTIISICALYIQLNSNEHIVSETQTLKIHKLFHASLLLILAPIFSYFVIENEWFRITAFRILHLPSLILAFIIASIASSVSHKRHPEQSYLLLTWLFTGSSLILEGSEYLGIQHEHIMNIASLPELSGIFLSLSVLFITFWVINHSAVVQKERIEAIQILFDGIVNKNKNLEINHARASDLAQEIYKDIKGPLLEIRNLIHKKNTHPLNEALRNQLQPLDENLQKLTILSQDLTHAIHAQHAPFYLHQMLERVPLAFGQRAAANHVTINLEVDQQLPVQVRGDQSLLYKAMLLIVEHRLEQLHHGSIRVFASRDNDPRSPQVHIKIRVEDSGSPYDKTAIDQFWSNSPTLGSQDFQLILARDMIFAMGGEFKISHEPGIGNCFTCRIILERVLTTPTPMETSITAETALAIPMPYLKKHALVMASSERLGKLQNLLQQLGFQVHLAANPAEASSTLMIEYIDVLITEPPQDSDLQQYADHARQINPNRNLGVIFIQNDPKSNDLHQANGYNVTHSEPVLKEINIDTIQHALSQSIGIIDK